MISFAYFDLGGVVEKDFSATNKWDEVREELGIKPSPEYEKFWADIEKDICTRREVDDLLPDLKDKFGAKIPDNYSLLNTFVKRFEKNPSIWPVIKEIQKTARIGLLTMMYPHMLDAIRVSGILPDINWDVVVDSSVVKLVKSDPQIYKLAQERAGVDGSEILFIENSKKYLPIAESFGWKTFWYDSSDYEKSSKELLAFWESIQ